MRQKEHRIYNPAMECISRDELHALQGERLVRTVKLEYENVPVYRARMASVQGSAPKQPALSLRSFSGSRPISQTVSPR